MTSAVLAPPERLPIDTTAAVNAVPPPRKRRRRTAGGGASNDCFTCSKRNAKCDRKRPYCTQCLDIGKECSGYKTALTWDVGVASRGKLRGLSCPVANKNVDGSDASPSEIEKQRRKSSTSKPKKEEPELDEKIQHINAIPIAEPAVPSVDMSSGVYASPTLILTSPDMSNGWHIPGFQDRMNSRQTDAGSHLTMEPPSIEHLHTALGSEYDSINMPQSSRSTSTYANTEFHSPMEYPHTPASLPFPEPLSQPASMSFEKSSIAAGSTNGFGNHSHSIDSFTNVRSSFDQAHTQKPFVNGADVNPDRLELDSFGNSLFSRLATYVGPVADAQVIFDQYHSNGDQMKNEDYTIDRTGLSLLDTRFTSPFFTMSPRLQSLMEYYSNHISPHLVAFDGPENPYRKHILQLALDNEGLQNAIAALSTNNFRMRKKHLRQNGFVEEITNAFNNASSKDWDAPTAEETRFKQISINQLNLQLMNKRAAQDDSVLAMLLILCLFHVCDSGFSQFQKQLAGVQQLLSLRGPNSESDFTKWVKMFFIWFDVMTSSVNDRELEIQGESLAMLDYSANLGALEQYSGCDGRLFKLIARLGRLNVLAQGRKVKTQASPSRKRRSMHSMPSVKRMRPTMRIPTNSLNPADYYNMDGNGWGTPILSSDEDADGSADEAGGWNNNRQDFWMEWHDIRNRLMSWQMDLASIVTPGSSDGPIDPTQLDAGQRDLIHINESFRFSALLYTERLGHPLLPSSHDQFQQLVSQVLYHITALPVTSCVNKFLMWPLFIAGTECVDEGHRDFIRRRCRDLTEESGFFNNISSLWVLEKVWKEVGNNVRGSEAEEVRARRRDSEASNSGRYGQAFRWRKAMDRDKDEGEYIVL